MRKALVVLVAMAAAASVALGQADSRKTASACDAYAAMPLPAEAQSVLTPKTAPGCASYRSYRGIGRPVNYAEARACAWQERAAQKAGFSQNGDEPTAWVVGGSLILADLYYNGAGVAVDKPLAMHFACEAEEQTAELAIGSLTKTKSAVNANKTPSAGTKKPFELCDYAMTTFMMNFCGSYEAQVQDDKRNREYKQMASVMTAEQRVAFNRLIVAERAYLSEHAWEVYQGGSIRNIRTMGSQAILDNLFHAEVLQLERKRWPGLSAEQISGADATMALEYKAALERVRAQPKDDMNEDVTAVGLLKAQRAWLRYRDAFSAFARLRYPGRAAAIRAEITLDRYRLLKTIP